MGSDDRVDRLAMAQAWMRGFYAGTERAGKDANDLFGAAELDRMADDVNAVARRSPTEKGADDER